MSEGAETVFSALDAMKRRAAADVLDHIADMPPSSLSSEPVIIALSSDAR